MSRRVFCLAAALALLATSSIPARACKARPQSASLCTVVPLVADVRDAPNGRVTSDAAGIVRVGGQSKDGLWSRVEVPCIGFMGWIARKDLMCENVSASAKP
ncbi:hypothetical protein QEV83_13110 [Methylocapsa sp. D3K7]|uniref:hypothetical protein n=1 Tax=Methylocapsa sp. D3K7 TaxID=3041435 RepID=UPI00244E74F3|nr:hypothetical protein [Methylocapsa sp. D3K7]WGJ13625.1 hypothetical protein QEV83_13110 [Methylocapsa sp. D3K7]